MRFIKIIHQKTYKSLQLKDRFLVNSCHPANLFLQNTVSNISAYLF